MAHNHTASPTTTPVALTDKLSSLNELNRDHNTPLKSGQSSNLLTSKQQRLTQHQTHIHPTTSKSLHSNNQSGEIKQDKRTVRFKNLLGTSVIIESDDTSPLPGRSLKQSANVQRSIEVNTCDTTFISTNPIDTIDRAHHDYDSAKQRKALLLNDTRDELDSDASRTSSPNSFADYSEDTNNLLCERKTNSRYKRRLEEGRSFRGSYRYTRINIVMAVFRKLFSFLCHRSTLSVIGAFLIHITLGTVYTLSNINSYLTSYMRQHGTPNATYGASMWISSSYAIGQGLSMVLGGYLEKRFSARLSCFIGCALHSLSTMATSKTIDHGFIAVLISYGFLPGFGCGMAYMTPMSNCFGWFPNRKGLVAGIILAGFGIGTFAFNMAQTAYVNPDNLSPDSDGYFTQKSVLDNVPDLFIFIGTIYASMQFVGCCLLFKPPIPYETSKLHSAEHPILLDTSELTLAKAVRTREFTVLFLVFGITNQGVLFVNAMLKEYGQMFIGDDMYLAWTGSMASIANSLGRLSWGLAIDRFSFTQCFTSITIMFGALMFVMPFEFILSSKLLFLLCTLGIFGSFSGWMSTYPVHLSRVFGLRNSGMIYGLIFVSQAIGGVFTAFGSHYLYDNFNRFVPFFCVTFLEVLGLAIYHLFYNKC